LVDKGLAASRQRARDLILAGKIQVNKLPAAKAGTLVSEADSIELKGGDIPYVSRGGLKLAVGVA
jgi:23S rRNA (cytidine1920-2'-O)/16S rRNA (cytidine1409-2'-O)-methyltransferase